MRKLSRMISLKVRRRTNGCPVAAGSGIGLNSPGMVVALVQSLSDSRRTSFVGRKRPLRFRNPDPEQLPGRTDERDFRFHQDAAADAETFAAATWGGVLGRRFTAAPSGAAAGL